MTPIRPTAPHPVQAGQVQPAQDREAAKLAAQRAFFAALGKSEAPAASTATTAATAPPSAPAVTAAARTQPPADAPQKILRPGSLIDIRV